MKSVQRSTRKPAYINRCWVFHEKDPSVTWNKRYVVVSSDRGIHFSPFPQRGSGCMWIAGETSSFTKDTSLANEDAARWSAPSKKRKYSAVCCISSPASGSKSRRNCPFIVGSLSDRYSRRRDHRRRYASSLFLLTVQEKYYSERACKSCAVWLIPQHLSVFQRWDWIQCWLSWVSWVRQENGEWRISNDPHMCIDLEAL